MDQNTEKDQPCEEDLFLDVMTTASAHLLFRDFVNDPALFSNSADFREYEYKAEKVDSYVSERQAAGQVLLAIHHKQDVVGEIRFKHMTGQSAELGIVLKNDSCKNRGIGTAAIRKSLDYAKEELGLKEVRVKILRTNARSLHVFEKCGFVHDEADDTFEYLHLTL